MAEKKVSPPSSIAPGGVVTAVEPGSPAAKLGIRPGWKLLEANSQPLWDILQYMFITYEAELSLLLCDTSGAEHSFQVLKDEGEPLGLEFSDRVFDGVRSCRNKCIFCFVDQMAPGLRPTLYVRDEDYRLSFLEGAYVTMSRFSDADLETLVSLALSPIYVSVHATDEAVRRRLLGIKKSRPILETLEFLGDHGIQYHTQIVLCPGFNDREVLDRTISDLAGLGEAVLSLSVVPVGLTRYREGLPLLSPVSSDDARAAIELIDRHRAAAVSGGRSDAMAYGADELFIKAGLPIPSEEYYDGYPQLENGVGSIRSFLDAPIPEALAAEALNLVPRDGGRVGIVTATGFAAHLESYLDGKFGPDSRKSVVVLPVSNGLFGPSVDVAGLLCFSDIDGALKTARKDGLIGTADPVLAPDIVLARGTGLFLDQASTSVESTPIAPEGVEFICFDDPPGLVKRIVEILSPEGRMPARGKRKPARAGRR